MPASMVGGSPAQMVPVPRIVLSCGVQNRAGLNEGWNLLLHAAEQSLQKLGQDTSFLNELPVTTTASGEAALYTLALPFNCPDMSPTIAVTDSRLTIGSSAALCDSVVKAPGALPQQPSVSVVFRPKPLSDLLKAEADVMQDEDMAEAAENAAALSLFVREASATVTVTPADRMLLKVEVTPAE